MVFKQCDSLGVSRNPRSAELRRKVAAHASKATGADVSLFVSSDNRQSSKGLNPNSKYGGVYHQMSGRQSKQQVQILIDNCREQKSNAPTRSDS